jgi:serine/threonine protein kinase
MLVFDCPACRQRLMVQDEVAGRKVKCPRCAAIADAPNGVSPAPHKDLSDSRTVPPSAADAIWDLPAQPSADPELYRFLAPPQAQDEIGRLGSYRVLQILGQGGMGIVFRAEDVQLKRSVALKAMLPALSAVPSCRTRFFQEARAAARIAHDHIVTVYQVGEEHGVPFLAMQLLEGETLESRLKRVKRLAVPTILRLGREIAEGLDAAHQHGLVHRDIKPSNLWLEAGRDRIKILDFGLARVARDDSHLTQSGVLIGTPAYLAPEQARGQVVGPRGDLFSLGCVLYRLCTGRLPFQGTDTLSTLAALATEEPPAIASLNPEIPPGLAGLVTRLLAKDPAHRPPSATAVIEAIDAIEGRPIARERPASVVAIPQDVLSIEDSSGAGDTEALEIADRGRSPLGWALVIACDVLVATLLVTGLVFIYRVVAGP